MSSQLRRRLGNSPLAIGAVAGVLSLLLTHWLSTSPASYGGLDIQFWPGRGDLDASVTTRFKPLPPRPPAGPLEVLGYKLFHDPRLSADGTISCASCHRVAEGGGDANRVSVGVASRTGRRNSPTVLNSGLNFRQFWDGRVETLEEQVDGPLFHPDEMATTWERVLAILLNDPSYEAKFAAIFSGPPTAARVRAAIAAYERWLITPNSPFDRWLRGDRSALSAEQLEGRRLFMSYGCDTCHHGVNLGGNLFQRLGVMADYFAERGGSDDLGRYEVTGNPTDRYVFRVPPLRNVALTAPYFHDGSCDTLEEAVEAMIRYQLGRPTHSRDVALLTSFLKSLTGEILAEEPR